MPVITNPEPSKKCHHDFASTLIETGFYEEYGKMLPRVTVVQYCRTCGVSREAVLESIREELFNKYMILKEKVRK